MAGIIIPDLSFFSLPGGAFIGDSRLTPVTRPALQRRGRVWYTSAAAGTPAVLETEAVMRRKWIGSAALLALLVVGCGEPKPTLAPVRGRVFYRGAPLAGGVIVFTPDQEHGGRGPQACARIGDNGAYVLSTGTDLGAVSGWHRVTFQGLAADSISAAPETLLPPRYSDPDQSDQAREVKAGQGNDIDFHLE
jgi:hypothetical protein